MTTIHSELKKLTKITRKGGETEQSYLNRLRIKANSLLAAEEKQEKTDIWDGLSADTQNWLNAANAANDADPPEALPSIPVQDEETKVERKAPANKKAAAKAKVKAAKGGATKAVNAKAKSMNGNSRGRPTVFSPEAKIKLLVKDNPFRQGSNNHKVFKLYKAGLTVSDFEKAHAKIKDWDSTPKMFLNYHKGKGIIAVA